MELAMSSTWSIVLVVTGVALAGPGVPQDPPPSSDEASPTIDFATQIRPIFEARCYECHGAKVRKARLRLDQRAGVFKTDHEDEWVIRPGKSAESPLFERISLPAGDFDIMPAEGDPLAAEEIDLIRRWIDEGAEWPESADAAEPDSDPIEIPEISAAERMAAHEAILRLEERGVLAMRIAADTEALYVNFSLLGREVVADDLSLLAGLEPVLVWLSLAGTSVTDESLDRLSSMKQLRRLALQNTRIGDAGVARLGELKELRSLNLYGTGVTDEGLKRLHGLENLRTIYLWRTSVTNEGASALRAALPEVSVDLGDYTIVTEPTEAAEPATEMTCCESAKAAGKACDHPCCIEAVAKGEVCAKCNPKAVK